MDEQSSDSPEFDFEAVFQVEDYLYFWDGQPISLDSKRMIIIARTYGEHE
jgi:hypothetical protein